MSNSGKVWDIREAYKQIRANTWEQKGSFGVSAGGRTPAETNSIEKININISSNATDFGDLTETKGLLGPNASGSFTRGIFAGGVNPSNSNVINSLEYSSDGNAVDFGDMAYSDYALVSGSDNTRLVIPQGSGRSTNISYLTIATKGNSADFGDTTNTVTQKGATSSTTRLIAAGGTSSPT